MGAIHRFGVWVDDRLLPVVVSGGPTLAANAFNAGLVDECHLLMYPVLVGQGKPAFPSDARAQLELLEEHQFDNGVVYVRYRTQS